MEFYNLDNLKRIAHDRGYYTVKSLATALTPYFGITRQRVIARIEGGFLTKEHCEVIGSFLEMTPKEYYETFMQGFFRQTRRGGFVCEVDDPIYHIRFSNRDEKTAERMRRKKTVAEETEAFLNGE